MTIKKQMIEKLSGYGIEPVFKAGIADQILDLVLNALTIEKKTKVTVDPFNMGSIMLVGEVNGHNKCVDQLEELKSELRK